MLRPIPIRIMTNSAVLKVPSETDRYGQATFTDYNLVRVHVQPTHEVRKSTEDKEVTLNAVLFYDPHISSPSLDWNVLQTQADGANAQMKVVFGGLTYTVQGIDLVPDDTGVLHHVEVALV